MEENRELPTCVVCDTRFESEMPKLAKYCSRPCRQKAKASRATPILCHNPACGERFSTAEKRQKFCSSSCSASFHNPRTKRKAREHFECMFCDKILSKSQEKFCSRECTVSYQAFTKYEDWLNGFVDASNEDGNLKTWARTMLLDMVGHRCKCGWGEINPTVGKPILTVDHIDGNWTNNYCWNLEVLCYNCHTLTPTFGSLNRGSVSGRRSYKINRDVRIV